MADDGAVPGPSGGTAEFHPSGKRQREADGKATHKSLEERLVAMEALMAKKGKELVMVRTRADNLAITLRQMQGQAGAQMQQEDARKRSRAVTDAEGFTLQQGRRRIAHQPRQQQQPTTTTGNSFAPLTVEEDDEVMEVTTGAEAPKRKEYVPPVYATLGAKELNGLLSGLPGLAVPGSYLLSRVEGGRTSIKARSSEARTAVLDALRAKNVAHFSYTPKGEKTLKMVLVGLDGFEASEVRSELLACPDLLVKPSEVRQMTRFDQARKQKVPLPLFVVTFPAGTKPGQLRGLTALFHCRVTLRPMRPSNSPTQCYRCQEYGHVSANCSMAVRCVKCGENHASSECASVQADSPRDVMQCCLCGMMGHPASFRGCPKAQEFMERRQRAQKQAIPSSGPRPRVPPVETTRWPDVAAAAGRRGGRGPVPVDEQPQVRGAWRQGPPPREPPQEQQQQQGQWGQVIDILFTIQAEMQQMREEFGRRIGAAERQLGLGGRF